jgi:hypothetical protein
MEKEYSYTVLGMLIGTAIGGAITVPLYSITGNPLFIAFFGLGTAFGLIYGAGLDRKQN